MTRHNLGQVLLHGHHQILRCLHPVRAHFLHIAAARAHPSRRCPRSVRGPWSAHAGSGARFSLPRWGPRGHAAKSTHQQRPLHFLPALGVEVWQVQPRLIPGPCSSARSGRSRGSLGLSLGLLGSLGSPPANPTLPTSASFSCPQPPLPFFFLLPKGHDRIVMRSTITMCV